METKSEQEKKGQIIELTQSKGEEFLEEIGPAAKNRLGFAKCIDGGGRAKGEIVARRKLPDDSRESATKKNEYRLVAAGTRHQKEGIATKTDAAGLEKPFETRIEN